MTKKDLLTQPFEENMAALEKTLQKLETDEVTLAESLAQFEAGMALVEACQSQLDNAEVTVEKIISKVSKSAEV